MDQLHDFIIANVSTIVFAFLLMLLFIIIIMVTVFIDIKKIRRTNDAVQNKADTQSDKINELIHSFAQRDELASYFSQLQANVLSHTNEVQQMTDRKIEQISTRFDHLSVSQEQRLDRIYALVDNKLASNEQKIESLRNSLLRLITSLQSENNVHLSTIRSTLEEKLTQNETRLNNMRQTLETSVLRLQNENSKKLDEMRQTVDEKLHTTLEKRLSESFSQVTQQLDLVSKGLGEMRSLATGVGDLKKVLTNVKTRGIWGEVQLGSLLEQMMSKSQYEENVAIPPTSSQRVEYAIKLPGQKEGAVLLPIDAKFPIETYERLMLANESAQTSEVIALQKELYSVLLREAKRISEKYIQLPFTTDFAIMYLPTEGLYAEALRERGLIEKMQEKYRILVTGPSTLSALLTSLQVGFRTLAIEQSSVDIGKLLSAVKADFSKFTELLDATQKKLKVASESIEKASSKSRAITKRLKDVEKMDETEAATFLEDTTDYHLTI